MPMRRDSKLSPSGACFAALLSLCCAIFCYALEVAAAPGKTEGSLKAAAILPISSVTLSVKADPYEPDGVTVRPRQQATG